MSAGIGGHDDAVAERERQFRERLAPLRAAGVSMAEVTACLPGNLAALMGQMKERGAIWSIGIPEAGRQETDR